MNGKWLWAETYVLWNELIWVLAKVGWYIDKKTTKVGNGAFDPSRCEKFVMCIMVYKLFWHFDIPTNAALKCKLLIDGGVNSFLCCWKMYFDQQNKDVI
jgi:hypothetical protein